MEYSTYEDVGGDRVNGRFLDLVGAYCGLRVGDGRKTRRVGGGAWSIHDAESECSSILVQGSVARVGLRMPHLESDVGPGKLLTAVRITRTEKSGLRCAGSRCNEIFFLPVDRKCPALLKRRARC